MLFLWFLVRIPRFPLHINIDGHGHAMLLTALFGEKRFSVVRANGLMISFLQKKKKKEYQMKILKDK